LGDVITTEGTVLTASLGSIAGLIVSCLDDTITTEAAVCPTAFGSIAGLVVSGLNNTISAVCAVRAASKARVGDKLTGRFASLVEIEFDNAITTANQGTVLGAVSKTR
jgi:hypothetical protein